MKGQMGYDHLAKLLIIGDSGVGKTNILLRFCENNFMSSHLTTIGRHKDSQASTSRYPSPHPDQDHRDRRKEDPHANMGHRRARAVQDNNPDILQGTHSPNQGAMGIVMVFALNDRASYNAMENWLKQIKTHAAENVVKVLVGNKVDVEDRKVSEEEGKRLAAEFGVDYFEVSAKDNSNIA